MLYADMGSHRNVWAGKRRSSLAGAVQAQNVQSSIAGRYTPSCLRAQDEIAFKREGQNIYNRVVKYTDGRLDEYKKRIQLLEAYVFMIAPLDTVRNGDISQGWEILKSREYLLKRYSCLRSASPTTSEKKTKYVRAGLENLVWLTLGV